MRVLACLTVLAAYGAAQDVPLIHAGGTSLETFSVAVSVDGVHHGTAKELAASFAQLQRESHNVRRQFALRFRDEHLDILRRYYELEMVKQQEAWYAERGRRDYQCDVVSVDASGDKATARLKRSWLGAGGGRAEAGILVEMAKRGGSWWLTAVKDEVLAGGAVERSLGVPPPKHQVKVPAAPARDTATPEAAVRSLHLDIQRLGKIRYRGSLSLQGRYFTILAAFYGEKVAAEAREQRPDPKPQPEVVIEFGKAEPRIGDMVRVKVLISEKIPDVEEELVSAVGQAGFDMRPRKGQWKIVREYNRPDPSKPLVPADENLALIFLVGK